MEIKGNCKVFPSKTKNLFRSECSRKGNNFLSLKMIPFLNPLNANLTKWQFADELFQCV